MLRAYHIEVLIGSFQLRVERYETKGKRNFIMGENGSGKSTFLKALCGINTLVNGSIYVGEKRVDGLPSWKRKISYIPQNLLLFPQYTVKQNLAISIRYGNGNPDIYRDVVKVMHLENMLERSVREISGGEAQRVAVARALISDPDVILMDEPFSMQDERSRMSLISSLFDLIDKFDMTYIYVTHNSRDLELGYDSLTILDNGKIGESVSSIGELRSYRSWVLMDYRNIIKIGDRYYRVNSNAIIQDKNGYRTACSFNGRFYVCTVQINGEKYFFTSPREYDAVTFDLSGAQELDG